MSDAGQRLQQALEMHDAGMTMHRMRLRRDNPQWSDAQVQAAVRAWTLLAPLEPGHDASAERWRRVTGRSQPTRP